MSEEPESVPASVRAQILATEHWGLLAVRSQTWSEIMGRISAQLTFTSASLVVVALAAQGLGHTDTFRMLATLAPSFVTGLHDDQPGVQRTYTMGPVRDVNHVLASASMFVIVVNSIVAGGLAAFAVWPLGPWVSALAAVLAASANFALWVVHGMHTYEVNTDPQWVRFPTPGREVS